MAIDTFLDESYWDERWQNGQTGWDIGHASTPLTAYFDQLEYKEMRILIPGCGNAYEAEYLYDNGFKNVFVVDMSSTALTKFSARCPSFPKDHLIQSDYFDLDEEFDLIVEQTFFCALEPKFRKDYVKKTHELLASDGILMGVLFDKDFGKPTPPFGGTMEEYLGLFQSHFLINTLEPCRNSIKPRMGSELFIKMEKS